ncbi:MAG: hypothetical protein IJX72_06845 [Clostridia bacterium]|nr:hypothetical protein [Clostridia bacterium]
MRTVEFHHMTLSVDFPGGQIRSLVIHGQERLCAPSPLFRLRLRDRAGDTAVFTAYDAGICRETADGAVYSNFRRACDGAVQEGLSVRVFLTTEQGNAAWRVSVAVEDHAYFVEWVDFPLVTLPALSDNNKTGDGGQILYPYNEGVLISDAARRQMTDFRHFDSEYPSLGCYPMFPNMVCSQMQAYLWEDAGLYIGAHDPTRALKQIDFYEEAGGVTLLMRLYAGVDFGETFTMDYPIIWSAIDGRWESAAEIYRTWFSASLPSNVRKIKDNPRLPAWYGDSPLVISYPVRGIHDMDEMKPNALYPYTNALPLLASLREATESRLLVLLMHWEGTAPWAPPYVWPPFGGVENFNEFKSALHGQNDLLGVYCSGFGYTIQSNLIAEYNMQEEYDREELSRGMCAGPDGKVAISKICTGQRSGYDICPASEVGHDLLAKAYKPLFESGLDYVQILDQNHGGGQYFCYSRDHGHPPAPGGWMTERMQEMLTEWNEQAPGMLFGCESAAAEPFIGNLQFSDNRFELNYMIGRPVPLYAYVYHEYLRNFMGNQVCCNLDTSVDTLRYRLAYSFSVGDCMTLVLTPDGNLMNNWGTRDFQNVPDKEKALRLIRNLTRFYREAAKPYLHAGRMIPALPVDCADVSYLCRFVERDVILPAVLTSAWESDDGRRGQILVNPEDMEVTCTVNGQTVTLPALDAVLVSI